MKKLFLTLVLIIVSASVFSQRKYTVSDFIGKKISYPMEEKYECKPTDRLLICYEVDSVNCINITHVETTNEKIVPYFVDKLKEGRFIQEEVDSCNILITFKKK